MLLHALSGYERFESTSSKQFEGSESWSIRETLEDGVNFGVRFANLEALGCVLTEVFFPSFSCGLPA
ncbi:hypothetical protein YC2023_094958 [Brassica napus]